MYWVMCQKQVIQKTGDSSKLRHKKNKRTRVTYVLNINMCYPWKMSTTYNCTIYEYTWLCLFMCSLVAYILLRYLLYVCLFNDDFFICINIFYSSSLYYLYLFLFIILFNLHIPLCMYTINIYTSHIITFLFYLFIVYYYFFMYV